MSDKWERASESGIDLGIAVSALIESAHADGLSMQEIVSVVISVAADYARMSFGDECLDPLAEVVRCRHEIPLTEVVVQ
jgi:hypothetical protein